MAAVGAFFFWLFFTRWRQVRLSETEINRIYDGQAEMDVKKDTAGRTMWDRIYREDVRQFDIVGHTNASLHMRESVLRACAEKGGTVRVLVLNPVHGFHSQLSETAHLINWPSRDQDLSEIARLNNKIEDTIRFTFELKKKLPSDAARRIQIRLATSTMYHNITRADNTMCVTHYLSGVREQGKSGPSLLLEQGDDGILFQKHLREFENLWSDSVSVDCARVCQDRLSALVPYVEAAVEAYRAYLEKDPGLIPLPVSAILFPTYRCQGSDGKRLCSYCSFSQFGCTDMSVETFDEVVRLLCHDPSGPRIRSLEISGGGEPLQHPEITQLLSVLDAVKQERPEIELGLLTNGVHMFHESVRDVGVFDYVRVSFPEKHCLMKFDDDEWQKYERGIITIRTESRVKRCGVKVLVTKQNQHRVHDLVKRSFETIGVAHVKVKAVRSPEARPSSVDLEGLADELSTLRETDSFYSGLSIDFPAGRVPSSRACWVSPLVAVIDPKGEAYKCCSISMAHQPTCPNRIAGIRFDEGTGFAAGWRSRDHLDIVQHVDVAKVCNNPCIADCRFIEYQRILEGILSPLVSSERESRPRML